MFSKKNLLLSFLVTLTVIGIIAHASSTNALAETKMDYSRVPEDPVADSVYPVSVTSCKPTSGFFCDYSVGGKKQKANVPCTTSPFNSLVDPDQDGCFRNGETVTCNIRFPKEGDVTVRGVCNRGGKIESEKNATNVRTFSVVSKGTTSSSKTITVTPQNCGGDDQSCRCTIDFHDPNLNSKITAGPNSGSIEINKGLANVIFANFSSGLNPTSLILPAPYGSTIGITGNSPQNACTQIRKFLEGKGPSDSPDDQLQFYKVSISSNGEASCVSASEKTDYSSKNECITYLCANRLNPAIFGGSSISSETAQSCDAQQIPDNTLEETPTPTPTPSPPDPPCNRELEEGLCKEVMTAFGPFSTSADGFIKSLFAILLSLSGGIALLMIIYSGYQIMVSRGDPEKLKEAKERLTSAIVGLLFLIFSLVILEVIGVDILNLPGLYK